MSCIHMTALLCCVVLLELTTAARRFASQIGCLTMATGEPYLRGYLLHVVVFSVPHFKLTCGEVLCVF